MYRLPSGKIMARRNGQVLGTYSSERLAARALATLLGVEVSELKRREARHTKLQGPVMSRGIYTTRSGKFEVRTEGQYCGRFDSATSAKRRLTEIVGVRPCLSTKVDRVELAVKRFASAKATFKTWRPADLKDLIEVRKNHALFCSTPGPLYMLAIAGKERSWRAAIVRHAQGLPTHTLANLCVFSDRIGSDANARRVRTDVAQDVHRILVVACQAMTERSDEEKAYWARHVNRNVAHHAGWLPLMQRMGILSKTTKRDKNRLVFGDSGVAYKIMPFSNKLVKDLTTLSTMQQVLLATPPPRTLDEWIEGFQIFKKWALQREKQDSYNALWMFRAAMIAERAFAGYKELGYSDENITDTISEAFPDMSQWVAYLCQSGRMRVGEFVRKLGYKDSIEYLTCDLCILMPVADCLATDAGDVDPQVTY